MIFLFHVFHGHTLSNLQRYNFYLDLPPFSLDFF